MAYAKRLSCDFYDVYDTKWTVEIHDESGVANSIMTMGPEPIITRWGGERWKSVVGSEATITITTSADMSWLSEIDETDIKIIIYKAGIVWWTGFALPDQFVDPLNAPKYYQIQASDRIGKTDLDFVDGSGLPYETWQSAIVIVANALKKTGLSLYIRVADNLYEDTMDYGDADDPVKQTNVRQDVIVDDELNPGSTHTMLKVLMNPKQCRIFQSGGIWNIMRIPELADDPLPWRLFDQDGAYDSNGAFTGATSQIKPTEVSPHQDFRMMSGAVKEAILPFKTVSIFANYDKRASIFRGYSFPENEFTGSTTLRHWTQVGASPWIRWRVGDDYMIWAQTFVGGFDNSKYIESEHVPVQVTSDKWRLVMRWGHVSIGGSIVLRVILDPTAPGNNYYLRSTGAWDNSGTAYNTALPCPVSTYDSPGESEMICNAIPVAGDVYIQIFAPYIGTGSNYYFVSEAIFQISPIGLNGFEETHEFEAAISANNNSRMEAQLFLSDSQETLNSDPAFRGILKENKTGTITNLWSKNGAGTKRTLVGWMQQWTNAETASYRWRGRIRGQADYFNVIRFTEIGGEIFVWEDVEYRVKNAIWEGSAIQLKGVLIDGETVDVSRSSSAKTGGAGGGGGSVVVPVTEDNYRAGSKALTAGSNSVPFSDTFTLSYVLLIHCLTAGGETVGYVITASDEFGFTITVDYDCTVYFNATKAK